MYHRLNMAQYRVYDMCRVNVWCIKVYKLCITGWIWPNTTFIRHVQGVCLMYKSVQAMYHRLNMAQYRCIRHVQGVCLMYKSVQGMYQWLNMAQYRVYRHVQGVCLMYKSVQAMYQWLNMAQYRVYDMYRVYVWCIKVYKLCITGWIWPNTAYIRHVQGVCLMYKSVQAMYHHLNMYRVYDMYRVYKSDVSPVEYVRLNNMAQYRMYTTCTGWMSDV